MSDMPNVPDNTNHEVYRDIPELGNRCIYDNKRFNVDQKLVQAITPFTVNLKNLAFDWQYDFLKANMNNAKSESTKRTGQIAACFRGYVKKNWLKLDSLFEKYEKFMNVELRDFLNLNDDGRNEYSFYELNKHIKGWSEVQSVGSQYHQKTAPDDKDIITRTHGSNSSDITVFNKLNAKFVNKDGREAVFDYNKKLIVEMPDMGTYNYGYSYDFLPGTDHYKYDIKMFERLNYFTDHSENKLKPKDYKYNDFLYGNSYFWKFK